MSLSLPQLTCSVCAQLIEQPLPGKIYCSRKCRLRAGRLAAKSITKRLCKGEIVKLEKRSCEHCNAEFQPARSNQTFCSASCRSRASNLRNSILAKAKEPPAVNPRPWLELKACKHCGKEFAPHHPNQLYCSLSCRVLADGQTMVKAIEVLRK